MKKETKELKAGSVIEFTKMQQKAVKAIRDRSHGAENMMEVANKKHIECGKELWGMVFQMYPALKDFNCTIRGTKEIVVERLLSDHERKRGGPWL